MRSVLRSCERYLPSGITALLLVPGLLAVSRWNYLLFHSLIEMISVVAAFGIFMIAWNTRHNLDNGYFLFLGPVFLYVGGLDLLHTLAYKGLGVFPGSDANLPTQLWIAARAVESLGLLLAPLFFTRRPRIGFSLLVGALLSGSLVAAIFSGRYFPDCFREGVGLTPFKIASEYVIVLVIGGALGLLWRHRGRFDPAVFAALVLALATKIGAELSFTLYRDVYGFSNLLGHLFKLLSTVLIYQALVETGITRPFDLLFRSLKRSEGALKAENLEIAAAREALGQKNAEYAQLIAEKNELLGIAAHDIRTPLSVIEMYSSFLGETFATLGDARSLKFIDIIRQVNRRALDMVSNVLDLTAIESGKLQLEARPLELDALVRETLEGQRILARNKGIEIEFDADEPLPAVPVDPLRFEQVLSNLLSNAVKFSTPGQRVRIRLLRRNGSVGLAVQDEGRGIPPEMLRTLFVPFSARGEPGTSGEKSTGLGLAIVQKIAASHGGSVEVDSTVGKGTTITVLFPARTPETAPSGPPARAGGDPAP